MQNHVILTRTHHSICCLNGMFLVKLKRSGQIEISIVLQNMTLLTEVPKNHTCTFMNMSHPDAKDN